jgi:hypothetical protein
MRGAFYVGVIMTLMLGCGARGMPLGRKRRTNHGSIRVGAWPRSVDDGPLGYAASCCYRIGRRGRVAAGRQLPRQEAKLSTAAAEKHTDGARWNGSVVFVGSKLAAFYGSRTWHALILHKGVTNRAGGRSGQGDTLHVGILDDK